MDLAVCFIIGTTNTMNNYMDWVCMKIIFNKLSFAMISLRLKRFEIPDGGLAFC